MILLALALAGGCQRRTEPLDPWAGVVEAGVDGEAFAEVGYEVARYDVGADAVAPYTTASGADPTFYVLRPEAPSGPAPVLLWLHGGAFADDSAGDDLCLQAADVAAALLDPGLLAPWMVADRGWAMVVPVNDFCDGWYGLGAEDPVDPERHAGHAHARRAVDFVRAGRAGVEASDALYGWGTSAGAAGVIFAAAQMPDFAGLIVDSAPCDLYAYHEEEPTAPEHVFGGAPDAAAERYARASCERLVADGAVTAPLYVAWNQQDALVSATHPESLIAALDAAYAPAGRRYGAHDFDHAAPGATWHVQTRIPRPPFTYTTELMFRFLEGEAVLWAEAEAGCATGCTVGAVVASIREPVANLSGGAGREALASEGPGVLYTGEVPAALASGGTATAILTVVAGGLPAETSVGRLRASTGEERALTLGDFAPEGGAAAQHAALIANAQGTAIQLAAGPGAVISVETDGLVDLRLDAIAYTFTP